MAVLNISKFLFDVPEGNVFVTSDGRYLKNLMHLRTCLRNISGKSFSHHVNNNKNDFAEWIKSSIGDEELFSRIRNKKTIKDHFVLIDKRVNHLLNYRTKNRTLIFPEDSKKYSIKALNKLEDYLN